jgi:hypothetical protein
VAFYRIEKGQSSRSSVNATTLLPGLLSVGVFPGTPKKPTQEIEVDRVEADAFSLAA